MILPLSMIRVRQSWDNGARVFARRRNTFSRQAVAPLEGVLNDRLGAVRFAARRTTNRGPSRPGDDCLGRTGAERRPPEIKFVKAPP